MDKQKIVKSLVDLGLDKLGSWALYDVPEEKVDKLEVQVKDATFKPFESNFISQINLDGMFLGLNAADRDVAEGKWQNFHDITTSVDGRPGTFSRDYKIIYLVKGTPLEGSYMTDLYKKIPETKAKVVISKIHSGEYKKQVNYSIDMFQKEYDLIQPKRIVCFGDDTYNELTNLIDENLVKLKPETKIIHVTHYSKALAKADFREQSKKISSSMNK